MQKQQSGARTKITVDWNRRSAVSEGGRRRGTEGGRGTIERGQGIDYAGADREGQNFIFIFIFISTKAVRRQQTGYRFTIHQGTTVHSKSRTGIGARLASAAERVCWTQLLSLYRTYGRCPVASSMAFTMDSRLVSWRADWRSAEIALLRRHVTRVASGQPPASKQK